MVAIASVEGGVRIEVRDNGVGIAPRESRRRSSTTASRRRRQGHGFGLHNCANAAQQMDGSLTAYSDGPGKGASFVLRMPVEYADELPQRVGFAEAGGVAMSDSNAAPRLIEPNRRILIVDDNRSIHEDFRKILGGARRATATSSTRSTRSCSAPRRRSAGRGLRARLGVSGRGGPARRSDARAPKAAAVRAVVRRRAHAAGARRHPDDGAPAARGPGRRHRDLLGVLGSQLGGDDGGVRQDGPRADPEEAVRHRRGAAARARAAAPLGARAARGAEGRGHDGRHRCADARAARRERGAEDAKRRCARMRCAGSASRTSRFARSRTRTGSRGCRTGACSTSISRRCSRARAARAPSSRCCSSTSTTSS